MDDITNNVESFLPPMEEEQSDESTIAESTEETLTPFGYNYGENLATILDEGVLSRLAQEIKEEVETDKESRAPFMERRSECSKYMSLKEDEAGLMFAGASDIISNLALQCVTEYTANASAELLPPGGPIRIIQDTDLEGDKGEEDRERREKWENDFFLYRFRDFYSSMKKTFNWTCWDGSSFRKVFYNSLAGRPTSSPIRIDNLIINYGATSLRDAMRVTEEREIGVFELQQLIETGVYRDIDIDFRNPSSQKNDLDDDNPLKEATDKAYGLEKPDTELLTTRTIREYHGYRNLDDYVDNIEKDNSDELTNGELTPYSITIDVATNKVLSMYDDWHWINNKKERYNWYVHYKCIEGQGVYGLGVADVLLPYIKASSELMRGTINGLMLSSMPAGVYSKSARLEQLTMNFAPLQFNPIDTGGEKISDVFEPLPFKEPSPQMNEMRKDLEGSAARLIGVMNQQLPDFNPNTPYGSVFIITEILSNIQSENIRSLRAAMQEEFELFTQLFRACLPEEPYSSAENSKLFVTASDFNANLRAEPIADAHVNTRMQRIAQSNALIETAEKFPQLHNMYEVLKSRYNSLKIHNIDLILPKPQETEPLDPVTENANIMMSKAVKAAIEQNHDAHIQTHQYLANDPNPTIAQAAMAHIQEHMAQRYLLQMTELMGTQLPSPEQPLPIEQQNEIAILAAQATQQLAPQQNQSSQPIDPSLPLLEEVKVKARQVELTAANDQEKIALDARRIEIEKIKAEIEYLKAVNDHKIEEEKISAQVFNDQLAHEGKLRENVQKSLQPIKPLRKE